jgi:transposase
MKNKTNYEFILGIDISKKQLDVCLTNDNKLLYQGKVDNTVQGLKTLQKKLKSLKISLDKILFCCENTGIYNSPLLVFTKKNELNLWLETPLTIKKSLGLTRGKSDKADALRIATYAYRYQDNYRPWTPPKKSIEKLQKLWKRRQNILKVQTQLNQNLKEIKSMQGQLAYKEAQRSYQGILQGAKKDLKQVEKDLKEALVSDKEIANLHEIITSIDGVGTTTAIYLIVLTQGFKTLNDPRKLACYAGVAPFPYTSGTSVRGKERISPFANQELKKLLHMCAVSVLRMKNKFIDFVNRKKKEGKHIMSIINALRNRILHTICACVRKNEKYDKNYTNSLA